MTPEGPCAGLRVVDFSRVLAAPYCTMVLGDLGAEVLKIERPGVGDDTRQWGPPFVGTESAYYLCINRNKKSLCLDLKHPEGVRVARELAARSDVLVENFRAGYMEEAGLGYAALSALNPRLIYCSVTGFGATGPRAQQPGYDFLVQAMGGLMSITGEEDGPPMKVGVAITDVLAGLFAAVAILAALQARERTGAGQHIDLSLLDCGLAALVNVASNFLIAGETPARIGNAHPSIVPYQSFATADGDLVLGVGNDGQWRRLCDLLERPEWKTDARLATNRARVAHRAEVVGLLGPIFRERATAEWIVLLEGAEVPVSPVNALDAVFAEPQVAARAMALELPHPTLGHVPMVGTPLRLSATPATARTAPPLLGEHTDAVLREVLGYAPEVIEALRAGGAVA
jgi:crotonobetainyl-CoA:carnitine CoA-transferase CaiB-like acyl-CoA transferase